MSFEGCTGNGGRTGANAGYRRKDVHHAVSQTHARPALDIVKWHEVGPL